MLSILIVEDDITFSLMLTTWLGKKGFVVRSSSSVSDAKRRLGEEAFDLVISDLRCLLYTSPSPRDVEESRMPSSA